jgi:hypothetical protein
MATANLAPGGVSVWEGEAPAEPALSPKLIYYRPGGKSFVA